MGFTGRIFRLEWPEGHQLHGLEVTCRPLSTGQLIDIWAWGQDASIDGRRAMFEGYAKLLGGDPDDPKRRPIIKEWNYEDDETGETLPVTFETMTSIDSAVKAAIVGELTNQAGGISDPLSDDDSKSGEQSAEGLIPMEYPSEFHGS